MQKKIGVAIPWDCARLGIVETQTLESEEF
jgi:hypothetical protein